MPELRTIQGDANYSAANSERVTITEIAPTTETRLNEGDTPASSAELQSQHDKFIESLKQSNNLVGFVTAEWDWAKTYRMSNGIDTGLLNALTARQGQYTGDKLAGITAINGSQLYDRIFTECARSAETYINDAISNDGTPWRLVAQRQAVVPEHMRDGLMKKIIGSWQQDAINDPRLLDNDEMVKYLSDKVEEAREEIHEENEKSARLMEEQCYDQFKEGGGWEALHEFVKDLCSFKTACIKGPIPSIGYKLDFVTNKNGTKKPVSRKVVKYLFKRVSPFDLFPNPGNPQMAKGNLTERDYYDAKSLLDMLGQDGWFDDAVRRVVEAYGEPGFQYITSFDSTRRFLEEHGTWTGARKGVIEALDYWGYARGTRIMSNSVKNSDKLDQDAWYHIHAIVCGGELLFCSLLDDAYDFVPYWCDSFSRIAGSAWGEGIHDLITDKEMMACACARSLSDNMAFCSGPIALIDPDQLCTGQDVTSPTPRQVIQISPKNGATTKPVEFQIIPSNTEAMLKISETMRQRAYDTIGMAPPDMGTDRAAGAGRTSSGLEELFGHRNRGMRAVVYGVDTNVGRQIFYSIYRMNMLYGKDNSIKAECDVEPQGILGAIAREQAGQKQQLFLQTVSTPNSAFAGLMTNRGKAQALRMMARTVYLPENIVVDDHVAAAMDKQVSDARKAQEQSAGTPAVSMGAQLGSEAQPSQQEQAQGQPNQEQAVA